MIDNLKKHFGYLFEEELLEEIQRVGIFKEIQEGEMLMDIAQPINFMPLILDGAIKVMREDDEGDDLLLYFIEAGDTCAMTISCCMGQAKSEIRAIAESNSSMIMLPVEKMLEWMKKYNSWQNFILQSYNERMHELLEAIDSIAFLKMDERLWKYLKDKAMVNHEAKIHVTHKEIAQDLHTSRVVISRLLKKMEIDKRIKMHRNQIEILDL